MKIHFAYKMNQDRAMKVCHAFIRSILNQGHQVWTNPDEADCLVMYGLAPGHVILADKFRAAGKPVIIIDLGYWNRNHGLGVHAEYKISLGSHHPDQLLYAFEPKEDRFARLHFQIEPWKTTGKHILLAGMGRKSYAYYGLPDLSWDMDTVRFLKQITDRSIVFRPKPSWRDCAPLSGTAFSAPSTSLGPVLNGAWCVVTHHSNVALDGLLLGIPCFTVEGAALSMSSKMLEDVERPYYPTNRKDFFNRVCHFNWSIAEIEGGKCWQFLWDHWLKDWKRVC